MWRASVTSAPGPFRALAARVQARHFRIVSTARMSGCRNTNDVAPLSTHLG